MTDVEKTYWQTLQDIFHGALELPAEQRAAWVEEACQGGPELAREVLELLASHNSKNCPIERAVSETAREITRARRKAPI